MESVATILTSPNAVYVISGIIIIICLLAYFGKKGLISFRGKGLSVGAVDAERTIVRQQIEYCKTATEIMTNKLIKDNPKTDEWRIKYICELVYDVYIEAISYNHITKDTFYVDNKFDKIWAIVLRETVTDAFQNEEFKQFIYKECKAVIEKLVDIKEYYNH